jgi:hypothetical protein
MKKDETTPAATGTENKNEVTAKQITEWKQKFEKVFQIDVTVKDVKKTGFYKKPDRKILGLAMKWGQNDPMKFNETLATNCFLGGDSEMQTNDDYFLSAATKFGDLVQVAEATIKEL